jgi:lipid II:glycine glycyltransferase (peptidoglycan interpeptide bridge formation enzyme)
LTASLGDRLTIHVASKGDQPIAGIVTLSFKKTIVYKYGGSDATHHHLGAMPFLFWKVIQSAKLGGFEQLDLGRSELEHHGLITFKEHLGAARFPLTYYRHPARRSGSSTGRWTTLLARQIFSRLPDPALDAAGRLLYKHLG